MKSKTHTQVTSVATFRDTANALHASFHEKMAKYGPNLFRVGHVKHLSSFSVLWTLRSLWMGVALT